MMSARGAADFLTRATAILATLFVLLSIVLAALAVDVTSGRDIDTSLERGSTPVQTAPVDPLVGTANQNATAQNGEPVASPAPAPASDPLAGQ